MTAEQEDSLSWEVGEKLGRAEIIPDLFPRMCGAGGQGG